MKFRSASGTPEDRSVHRSGKSRYVLLRWKSLVWGIIRNVFSWSVVIITLIASLVAFMPAAVSEWIIRSVNYTFVHPYIIIAVLLLMAVVAAVVSMPRTKAVYKDRTSDIRVIVECCDILRQSGMKIIHVVDTFDTELDRIITPRSLHGAFLQLCQREHTDIDAQIDATLLRQTPEAADEHLPGRKNRYALGTVCPVHVNGEPFACVAFTHLQPDGNIQITKAEYIQCLKKMWRNLSAPTIRQDELNVAVMGNRFVDLPAEFSTEQKIDIMVQTFFVAAKQKACCRTLRICVHPNDVADIDFASYPIIMKHLARRPVL